MKEQISPIYNHSKLTLSEGMKSILNRGLNFCVTPLKLNITEVLVDYRKYERKIKWVEFFNNQEEDDTQEEFKNQEIFPKEKSNLPPNTSAAVKTFLTSVKSKLAGTKYNNPHPNINKKEKEALETLIELQRNCVKVIKPCNRGAGIIICDYDSYVTSCKKELDSITTNGEKYYEKITQTQLTNAKKK
jgi:hypothetical protein